MSKSSKEEKSKPGDKRKHEDDSVLVAADAASVPAAKQQKLNACCFECKKTTYDMCYFCPHCYADGKPEAIFCFPCMVQLRFEEAPMEVDIGNTLYPKEEPFRISNHIRDDRGSVFHHKCGGCGGIRYCSFKFSDVQPHVWTKERSPNVTECSGADRGCTWRRKGGATIEEYFNHTRKCPAVLVFTCPFSDCSSVVAPDADDIEQFGAFADPDDPDKELDDKDVLRYYYANLRRHLSDECTHVRRCFECAHPYPIATAPEHALYHHVYDAQQSALQSAVESLPERKAIQPLLQQFKMPYLLDAPSYENHVVLSQTDARMHMAALERFPKLIAALKDLAPLVPFFSGGSVGQNSHSINVADALREAERLPRQH